MGTAQIVPGWYADPMVPGHIRYWDGGGWTEHSAEPLPSAITHPSAAYFAPANLALAVPLPVPTPRPPRRRLPLPALFVLGTALIGFPLAIGIGVIAARASAPPALETPVRAENPASAGVPARAENPADAAATKDATAIGLGIERFYQQTPQGGIAAPVVTVSDGTYILGPVETGSGEWTWPPISMSEGVALGGQTGTRQDDWCVWVRADGGTVKNWQVTTDGVGLGTCGSG